MHRVSEAQVLVPALLLLLRDTGEFLPLQSRPTQSSNTGPKYLPPCESPALLELRLLGGGHRRNAHVPFCVLMWRLAANPSVTLLGRRFYIYPPPITLCQSRYISRTFLNLYFFFPPAQGLRKQRAFWIPRSQKS